MSALTTTAGAGLILSAGSVQRLNELHVSLTNPNFTPQRASVAHLATSSAAGVQFLAGVAVTVLGILGLTRTGIPLIMSSVGLLVLGCAITLSGTALASRMLKFRAGTRRHIGPDAPTGSGGNARTLSSTARRPTGLAPLLRAFRSPPLGGAGAR